MKTNDQLFKILLEVYTAVYKELGVDFETMKKPDGFYLDYELEHSIQQNILDKVFKKYKLSKLEKQQISNSFWLGVSPKDKI